eukprot:TRINITY_DN1820_c0_g2_i1.p1 TRINITY_DN1820_c0_g2~~TRINITY_DN1820_c0_g2_i1.p1  ORF type:complete len:565 (+),score=161.68 TRINITY_DN1820_c0_g2_i1:58-1752(+)
MPLYEEKFICPLAIRFSQARIRPHFQDGREVEASMEEVEAVECPKGGAISARYDLLLRAPFPPIEIIRWWPKLREEDGETLVDEHGKTILGEPCWFTFDNRRLYCLQAAAAKHWPARIAAVVHIMHDLPLSKCAPKKFRTTDLGCSVRISRRYDPEPTAIWNWMEASEYSEGSEESTEAMGTVSADASKEHWSELLDVPQQFLQGQTSSSAWQDSTTEDKGEEAAFVNTRTARRLLKAGGSRVSRGGTEAHTAAAVVAAAKAGNAGRRRPAKDQDSGGDKEPAAKTRTADSSAASSSLPESAQALPLELRALLAAGSQTEGTGYGAIDQTNPFAAASTASQAELAAAFQMAAAAAGYSGAAAQSPLTWQFQQHMMHMQMQQMQRQQHERVRLLQQQKLQQQREAQQQKEQKARAKKAAEALARAAAQKAAADKAAAARAAAERAAAERAAIPEIGSTLLAAANTPGAEASGASVASLFQMRKHQTAPTAAASSSAATTEGHAAGPPSGSLFELFASGGKGGGAAGVATSSSSLAAASDFPAPGGGTEASSADADADDDVNCQQQ